MSKDLTPLEALENIKREAGIPYFSTLYDIDMWREDFKTVETALKDIDFLKTLNENQKHNIEMLIEENREMKKSLKALVIIREAKEEITEIIWRYCKTSEEFKLIKEILK